MARKLPPLLAILILWHVGWGALALATNAPPLIEFLNFLLLSCAIGALVTFFTRMWAALFSPNPRPGDIVSFAIWWGWFAWVETRLLSLIWRYLDKPDALIDSDLTTHTIAIALLAALGHIAGPEAIEGRVPTKEWVRIGAFVAAGLSVFVCLVFVRYYIF